MFMESSKLYNSAALSAIQPGNVSDLGVSVPRAVIPCSVVSRWLPLSLRGACSCGKLEFHYTLFYIKITMLITPIRTIDVNC